MKIRTISNVIIALCVLALCTQAMGAPMKVTADKIQGKVEMREGSGAWKTLSNGANVPLNAEIKTGAGASCMLKWAGGNVVKVGPMSQLKVSEADKGANGKENSTVSLSNGKVSAHAKKFNTPDSSFKVKTPTAVAGVRGTDLIGEYDESTGDGSFGVADGSVGIENGGGEIILDEGFMIDYSDAAGFTEPEMIPQEELEQIQQEFDEINTEANVDAASYDETADEGNDEEETDVEEEEPLDEISADDVLDVIDTAINDDIISDIVSDTEEVYDTGDVEVIIQFGQ